MLLGFLGCVAAFDIACNIVMAVAIAHRHTAANWSGQQKGEGFEYPILAVAIALAIMVKGSAAFSADRTISQS